MADNENGQEKTEEPTSKRLEEARQKGQVPRSRELNTAVVLVAGAGTLIVMSEMLGRGMVQLMEQGLKLERSRVLDSTMMAQSLGDMLLSALGLLTPYLLVLMVAVLATPLLIGGWSFSSSAMAPKFSRLDPIKGVKRLVSPNGLMELVKSLAKIFLIGGVGYVMIAGLFDQLMALSNLDTRGALAQSFDIVGWVFLGLSASMILIAAVDVPFQLWNHKRQLKMTKQEVKEEHKKTEGNPEIKSRIRRVQQEVAMRRMMAEVPKADVVITNPTHFAVALRYDEKNMKAPRVVAKGADLVAAQIRTVARENKVTMFAAPPLARALYYSTELNREIPAGLYLAVAQVLAYVYQLKMAIHGTRPKPNPPKDLTVPDEFLR